jgi:hypothetical protein
VGDIEPLSDAERELIDGKPYAAVRWLDVCPLKVRGADEIHWQIARFG